jgi:hypothetical protein
MRTVWRSLNRVVVTAAAAGIVAAWGTAMALAAASPPTPYKSDLGYTITPAKGWTVAYSGANGYDVFIYGPEPKRGFRAKLYVVVKPMFPPYNYKELLPEIQNQMRSGYKNEFTNFHLIKDGFGTAVSTPTYELTGTYDLGDPPSRIKMHHVYVVRAGHMYTFSCMAQEGEFPKYKSAFDTMIKSIQWTRETRKKRPALAPEGPQ